MINPIGKNNCEYPECPTKETSDALKDISDKISDYKVIETDIRYIREMIEKVDVRLSRDIDALFERMRYVEANKLDRKDIYAAIGATGTVVGILSFVVQMVMK